jgi:hypothetical protein
VVCYFTVNTYCDMLKLLLLHLPVRYTGILFEIRRSHAGDEECDAVWYSYQFPTMEIARLSETFVSLYQTTHCQIPCALLLPAIPIQQHITLCFSVIMYIRWTRAVSFTVPHYLRRNTPRHPLYRSLREPLSQYGRYGVHKNILPLSRIEPW